MSPRGGRTESNESAWAARGNPMGWADRVSDVPKSRVVSAPVAK